MFLMTMLYTKLYSDFHGVFSLKYINLKDNTNHDTCLVRFKFQKIISYHYYKYSTYKGIECDATQQTILIKRSGTFLKKQQVFILFSTTSQKYSKHVVVIVPYLYKIKM